MSGEAPPRRRLAERPVLVVALAGLAFVVLQIWWISRARSVGAFDVDEEGGLAAGLRFHRTFLDGPTAFLAEVFGTRNGPMVPILAVPFLLVGPRSTTTVMAVQPVLVALGAIGTAGIVARLAGARAALVAGLLALTLPISIVSSRSFQYSTGVGAFLALGTWALVASERGQRRGPMLAFGICTGAMLLSRTMSAGFLPAIGLAALVVVRRDRRGLLHLAGAAAACLVVAGPWWVAQWDAIREYLVTNAYGDRAHYWGATSMRGRLVEHMNFLYADFRMVTTNLGAASLGVATASLVAWRASGRSWRSFPAGGRTTAAVWIVTLLGFAVLNSTSNVGFWFAYPLDLVLVAGSVAVVARTPVPSRWWQPVAGALVGIAVTPKGTHGVIGVAAFGLVLALGVATLAWWRPRSWAPGLGRVVVAVCAATTLLALDPVGAGGLVSGIRPDRSMLVGDLDEVQAGNLWSDARLASSDLGVRHRAAAEWFDATRRLAAAVEREGRRHGTLVQTITGSGHLLNTNTILLAEELTRQGIHGAEVVNTLEPPDEEIAPYVRPRRGDLVRVLVVIELRSLVFPDDRGQHRLLRLARRAGWRPVEEIPLPDGGRLGLWTHPDNDR